MTKNPEPKVEYSFLELACLTHELSPNDYMGVPNTGADDEIEPVTFEQAIGAEPLPDRPKPMRTALPEDARRRMIELANKAQRTGVDIVGLDNELICGRDLNPFEQIVGRVSWSDANALLAASRSDVRVPDPGITRKNAELRSGWLKAMYELWPLIVADARPKKPNARQVIQFMQRHGKPHGIQPGGQQNGEPICVGKSKTEPSNPQNAKRFRTRFQS